MLYDEENYLMLSGIQHFVFCKRQWALIHVEGQWVDNLLTTDGSLRHERVHDDSTSETRGDLRIVRGLAVSSSSLGLSGECDVVEFRDGGKCVYPIEYKRGKQDFDDAARSQLCAQAICLEKMLCVDIPVGALFHVTSHRREEVTFSRELRDSVIQNAAEMHEFFAREHTPKVRKSRKCRNCSMVSVCLPELDKVSDVAAYIQRSLSE
ncbi:CRISPR-associated protein Cas4 [Clostridia bacterium]|nr:CRISPR-associated protein Cas4 [Clostridia bacterium]